MLVVDNFDSFVYNLVQYLSELGAVCEVRRNDTVDSVDVSAGRYDGVLISPGPGHPRVTGRCADVVRACAELGVPVLGVCLGHQLLGDLFGGHVGPAPELLHGRASVITHDGRGIFEGLPSRLVVGRYHSLAIDTATLPDELEASAWAGEVIMAVRHRTLPLEGVQFHPESVLTEGGYLMLANWLTRVGYRDAISRAERLQPAAEERRRALPAPSAS